MPQENAAHIRLKIDAGFVARKGENATRSRRSNARQGKKLRTVARQLPLIARGTFLRTALQHERAAVVSKPLPILKHNPGIRGGEGIKCWKERHEALPVPQHALHLRLLEHDLGDQHGIVVIDIAPRQIAPMELSLLAHLALECGNFFRRRPFPTLSSRRWGALSE